MGNCDMAEKLYQKKKGSCEQSQAMHPGKREQESVGWVEESIFPAPPRAMRISVYRDATKAPFIANKKKTQHDHQKNSGSANETLTLPDDPIPYLMRSLQRGEPADSVWHESQRSSMSVGVLSIACKLRKRGRRMQQRRSRGLSTQGIRRALCCLCIRKFLRELLLLLGTRAFPVALAFDSRCGGPVSSSVLRERERVLLH